MECKIDGCKKLVHFKGEQLCQMHYFRKMRYGTFDLTRKPAKERIMNPDGYILVYAPNHPLAIKRSYVYEHRKIVYDIIGDNVPDCILCGVSLTWKSARIDHIDRNITNNHPSNLRPLCNKCNTWRDMPPQHTFDHTVSLTFDGKTATANEWAKDKRVKLSNTQIILRKRSGYSDFDALFAPKKTHNGNIPVKPVAPPKHTRRNAINITIDGELKTSMEWSRDGRCEVSDGTLRNRVKSGWAQTLEILLKRKRSTSKSCAT